MDAHARMERQKAYAAAERRHKQLIDQWGRHHVGGGWHGCTSKDAKCNCFKGTK